MNTRNTVKAAPLIVLLAGLAACTISNIVQSLNLVVGAASVAVPVIQSLAGAGNLDPATAQQIAQYLSAVSDATAQTAAELQTTDPQALKITKITGYYATIVAPALGNRISPEARAAIGAVVAAVNSFLSQLKTTQTAAAVRGMKPADTQVSYSDRRKLGEIRTLAAGVKAKCATVATTK